MDDDVIRAWWAHKQGLEGSLEGASAAVARMEEYIRSELGECRSFGMDRPESRKLCIVALRELAAVHT